MKTKHDYQNEFEYQGVFFHIRYEWPAAIRHKAAPCRGCIDPLDPMTGKKLTKRQVYGKDSDCPVRYRVYGKDPQDIWDNHRETAAAYLISHMVRQGLIESKPAASNERGSSADLAELARDFKEDFFAADTSREIAESNKKPTNIDNIILFMSTPFNTPIILPSLYYIKS